MTIRSQLAYAAIGVVLVLGLLSLFNPVFSARLLGLDVAIARGISEVRSTYGAMHVTLAAMLLWAMPLRPRSGMIVRLLGLLWMGAAAGRVASIAIDGVVTPTNLLLAAVQLAVAGLLVWASFEIPPSPAEQRARREETAARRRLEAAKAAAKAGQTTTAPASTARPPASTVSPVAREAEGPRSDTP